jgi:prevent-host-death family protein
MKTLGVRELKERISEILRMVHEDGETVEVTNRGEVIARLVPVSKPRPQQASEQSDSSTWTELDRLANEIGNHVAKNIDAVDAVHDVRRDL